MGGWGGWQVDEGVLGGLYEALKRDTWDVMIAHFLGVVWGGEGQGFL